MTVERVVVDTSVLISAALSAMGRPAAVVDFVVDHARFVFSVPTFDELVSRLARPKFDRYLSTAEREAFVTSLARVAVWTDIAGTLRACRDPGDDKFLETALAGQAECIVTGDQDLLVLDPFQGIPIVTAAGFLTRVSMP
jgi:hypothetical protein